MNVLLIKEAGLRGCLVMALGVRFVGGISPGCPNKCLYLTRAFHQLGARLARFVAIGGKGPLV